MDRPRLKRRHVPDAMKERVRARLRLQRGRELGSQWSMFVANARVFLHQALDRRDLGMRELASELFGIAKGQAREAAKIRAQCWVVVSALPDAVEPEGMKASRGSVSRWDEPLFVVENATTASGDFEVGEVALGFDGNRFFGTALEPKDDE